MPRYEGIAEDANKIILPLVREYELTHNESETAHFTEQLLRLYNLGIRTSPRPCQATVRQRAVTIAAKTLPVTIGMRKVHTDFGKSYYALTINNKTQQTTLVDSTNDEE